MPVSEDTTDYRKRYRNLKRKFKFLIYENECFQEELRKAQRKLLKISRDKSFLLDRLLQYESVESSSSDSEATESSDSEAEHKHDPPPPPPPPPVKKKKPVSTGNSECVTDSSVSNTGVKAGDNASKKKKTQRKPPTSKSSSGGQMIKPIISSVNSLQAALSLGDGHMTSEEIERHLEAKQALRDLLPEKAPLTVPMELFSTEPSTMDRSSVLLDTKLDIKPIDVHDLPQSMYLRHESKAAASAIDVHAKTLGLRLADLCDIIEDLHMEQSPIPAGKNLDEDGLVIDLPD